MFCNRSTLEDYLLPQYLNKADELREGIVDRMILSANTEVAEALPTARVTARLKRIASVLAAYRISGAITTFIMSEGSTDNPFLYLQREYHKAIAELDYLRDANGSDEDLLAFADVIVDSQMVDTFSDYERFF